MPQAEAASFCPYLFPSTTLIVDGEHDLGAGTFAVRESDVAWTPNTPTSTSVERVVPFRSVSLSAIATDPTGRACLYLQTDRECDEGGDGMVGDMSNGHDGRERDDREDDADPLEALSEMSFVFSSEDDLQKAFEAMCEGALRNPDSDNEEDGEEMGMGGWFTSGSLAEGLEANIGLEDSADAEDGDA